MERRSQLSRKTAIKKKMLDASIQKHQRVIEDFKQSIQDLLASEGLMNEEEMDLSQQGFNEELIHRVNALADQLNFANEEMTLLYKMLPTIGQVHQRAGLGSVVITDKNTFFVSASIEAFEVEGQKAFGLSRASPLFKAMEGKRKGDTFSYKEHVYEILDVF